MKILVTGGMGFIGSNFIRHLYQKYPEYEIINFDVLSYAGNVENLYDIEGEESERAFESSSRRYNFVKGDIADIESVHDVVERHQPDIIVNFAAESHVDRSIVDSSEFIRSNVVGAHILLELSRKYNIRLVHISTDEIYGDVLHGESSEDGAIRPSNPYAASKAAADVLAQSYIRTHHAPVIIVRGSNNFGPYQYPEKLLPLAITNLIEGAKIPIHGSGKHLRRWLHVSDFSEAIDLLIHEAKIGDIYNVAGREHSNFDLVTRVAEISGLKTDEVLSFVGDRPGADFRYAPSGEKLLRQFGWSPKRHLEETLPEIVRWYKDHPQWWKSVKEKSEFQDHYEKQRFGRYY